MEEGKPQSTPAATKAAMAIRTIQDDVRDLIIHETGDLTTFIHHYLPHIWADPDEAAKVFNQTVGRRPLEGDKSFLKQRIIPKIRDGLRWRAYDEQDRMVGSFDTEAQAKNAIPAGGRLGPPLKLVTDNPSELVVLRVRQMVKYLTAHRIWNEEIAKGRLTYVPTGGEKPEGYAAINDSLAKVFKNPNIPIKEAFDKRQMEALGKVADALGVTTERRVKLGGQKWGFQKTAGNPEVVTKFGGPESVLAHEIGHAIDDRYDVHKTLLEHPDADLRRTYKAELRKLADLRYEGQDATDAYARYVRKGPEKAAAIVEAYVHAPDKLQEAAPHVYDWFTHLIASDPKLAGLKDAKTSLVLGAQQATVHAGGAVLAGTWYAPEASATVLNNFLSPGISDNPLYRGWRAIGNDLLNVQLGMSAFHMMFTAVDSMTSADALAVKQLVSLHPIKALLKELEANGVAPFTTYFKGNRLLKAVLDPGSQGEDMGKIAEALMKAGGRVRMDSFYRTGAVKAFMDALGKGHALTAMLQAPRAVFEAASWPILQQAVPRMKLGIFHDLAKYESERLGPDATVEQQRLAMGKAWDSVDNRMGQLVYDNLFWNKTLKDVSMVATRSVGWNLGTDRELGGAGIDTTTAVRQLAHGKAPEVTHRMAYAAALVWRVGLIGALMTYLYTGRGPRSMLDYVAPPTGRKDDKGNEARVQIASYMKDLVAYYHHPVETVLHKVHPLIAVVTDIYRNKDYYGTEIHHPDDPVTKQAKQVSEYLAKQYVPFSVRNLMKERERGQSWPVQLQAFGGIMPAQHELTTSKAQLILEQSAAGKAPQGARTQEQTDKSQAEHAALGSIRRGDRTLAQVMSDPKITPEARKYAAHDAIRSPIAQLAEHADIEAIRNAMAVATPEELAILQPILARRVSGKRLIGSAHPFQNLGRPAAKYIDSTN